MRWPCGLLGACGRDAAPLRDGLPWPVVRQDQQDGRMVSRPTLGEDGHHRSTATETLGPGMHRRSDTDDRRGMCPSGSRPTPPALFRPGSARGHSGVGDQVGAGGGGRRGGERASELSGQVLRAALGAARARDGGGRAEGGLRAGAFRARMAAGARCWCRRAVPHEGQLDGSRRTPRPTTPGRSGIRPRVADMPGRRRHFALPRSFGGICHGATHTVGRCPNRRSQVVAPRTGDCLPRYLAGCRPATVRWAMRPDMPATTRNPPARRAACVRSYGRQACGSGRGK
jgi:hypothetical protein